MIYRIKQFYLSLTAKMSEDDISFIKAYLDEKEQRLFKQLQVGEQKHCVNVAYDIKNKTKHMDLDMDYLMRLALLHDIGKTKAKLTPIHKAIFVVLDALTKGKLKAKSKNEKVNVYYNHGEIGAQMLKELGGYDKIFLERVNHHHCNNENDKILSILQEWDNKN